MALLRSFEDRVVIVTGAARGIGLACARRFVAEGARVVLVDRDVAAGQEASDLLGAPFVEADVSLKPDVERAVAEALRLHGHLDVLVNNAGVAHRGDFLGLSEDDFDRVLRVNLKSAFLCGQAVARAMVAQERQGAIVNLSSVNAVRADPDGVAYSVSKAAVAQLTVAMAMALAPRGIRVNAIGPGTISTGATRQVLAGSSAAVLRVLGRTPLGRLGGAEEIAAVAAFLASDEASYLTGQTLYVDGGQLGLDAAAAWR